MKLFIHFGIYKAGSSYLQYICANNREYLKAQGYYLPESPFDKAMEKGEISPGNGLELHKYLEEKDNAKIESILNNWVKQAIDERCDHILITAEALVHNLAQPDQVVILEQATQKAGINGIYALGYFRHLADHALSTYKHRAKSGKIPDYKYWLKNVYETPAVIKGLLKTIDNSIIKWRILLFKKNSEYMIDSFFCGWLEIKKPYIPDRPKVNESITLSEVRIMTYLLNLYPLTSDYFVYNLKNLNSKEKALDKHLEIVFKNNAEHILQRYLPQVENLSKHMPEDSKLLIQEIQSVVDNECEDNTLYLSEKQIENISNTMKYLNSFRGRFISLRRSIYRLLPSSLTSKIVNYYKKNYELYK